MIGAHTVSLGFCSVPPENPRQIAAQVLLDRRKGGSTLEENVDSRLATARLASKDRGLVQELVYGVVRWQATLDWLIDRKATARKPVAGVRTLLRLGLYQLFLLNRIPDHAAVNETVESAKQLGYARQAGLLNAILRAYVREKESTRSLLAELKTTGLALGYSHPEWLCARWEARWGKEATRRLLEWNNRPAPVIARLNTLKFDHARLLAAWKQEGLEPTPVKVDWAGDDLLYELASPASLAGVASFREGGFYIQDPSTLLAVTQLDPKPGERLLDFCAAPGGKTTFIAQLMQNQGELIALEPSPSRLQRLRENCHRLGVRCANLRRKLNFGEERLFDRVLVDVPCSNTGVMRRRVELRWRLRPEELERLARNQ